LNQSQTVELTQQHAPQNPPKGQKKVQPAKKANVAEMNAKED
jgi:hypothetical protein